MDNTAPVILSKPPFLSSHESHGMRMFANGQCDSKGLPRPSYGITATRVKRSSQPTLPANSRDILEVTDTPSSSSSSAVERPVIEKPRKSSKALPIVVPSSSEANLPEPQPTERKRRAAAPPGPHVSKKRVKSTRIRKITTSAEFVDSSDDEINGGGGDDRKEVSIEPPKLTRPKPRQKKPNVNVPANDIFRDNEDLASSDLEDAISTSLRKDLKGPPDAPEPPPSPSPRPDPPRPLLPVPLKQLSLPLPVERKACPSPAFPNAPLLVMDSGVGGTGGLAPMPPPSTGEGTAPNPPPNRQEMALVHPQATLLPHSTSGDPYQTHPPVNSNNYYPHGNYNQHPLYPSYYGAPHAAPVHPTGLAPHAAVPPSVPHAHIPSFLPHAPNPPPAPHASNLPPHSDPRGYHDASNPSYPRGMYQYPGTFRAPNDGPQVVGYPGEYHNGAVDHRGYFSDLLARSDGTNGGMSYQSAGPPDMPQSTLPTLPSAP
ncbi:hypothetical protein J3R83DRAFT_12536 [Lanmaoa asiatica]|nr:hypothetical protein J3R83DRAFT_12536 [Lanmaoa asiatica]